MGKGGSNSPSSIAYPKLITASISVLLPYYNLLNKNQGVLVVFSQPGIEDEDVENYTASTNTEHPQHKFSHLITGSGVLHMRTLTQL